MDSVELHVKSPIANVFAEQAFVDMLGSLYNISKSTL
jgi:hypothetical protein